MAHRAIRVSNIREDLKMTGHLYYYGKAYVGCFVAGLAYLMSVLAPSATLGSITLLQWIGFAVATLGTWAGVASFTNGPKPGGNADVNATHNVPNPGEVPVVVDTTEVPPPATFVLGDPNSR